MQDSIQRFKFQLTWWYFRQTARDRRAGSTSKKRIIIVPPDPWELSGSRGDEAMIRASIAEASSGGAHIAIVVATDKARLAAQALNVEPLKIWNGFRSTTRAILDFMPDAAVLIGADCMDGYYNPMTSARFIATADILARNGIFASFTGFSFNDRPDPFVIQSFERLSPQTRVNLRDPVSLQRFRQACGHAAHLVADAAFMLKPATSSTRLPGPEQWIAQRRKTGTPIIAFNTHPHLAKDRSPASLEQLVKASSAALSQILSNTDVSVLLMAHDYRDKDADHHCLHGIAQALAGFGERVCYPAEPFSAAELKRLAGMVDGVVTGRMHLAIASLGMGVPIAAIAYQGKFKGLLQHFDYPQSMQIGATDAVDGKLLHDLIERFIAALPELKQTVAASLPKVRQLASDNFRQLAP